RDNALLVRRRQYRLPHQYQRRRRLPRQYRTVAKTTTLLARRRRYPLLYPHRRLHPPRPPARQLRRRPRRRRTVASTRGTAWCGGTSLTSSWPTRRSDRRPAKPPYSALHLRNNKEAIFMARLQQLTLPRGNRALLLLALIAGL